MTTMTHEERPGAFAAGERLSQMLALERPFVRANITAACVAARGLPEEVALPHQSRLEDHSHTCCIHGRNSDGDRGT